MVYFITILSISLILYFIYVPHKNAFYDLYLKTLSSLCFVGLAFLLMGYGNDAIYMERMLLGFGLGMAGDVFLALPFCYPQKREGFFFMGLTSFLLGHLAFVWAMFHTSSTATLHDVIVSVLGGCLTILILKRMKVDFANATIPSMIYAIVILFMECQALSYLLEGINSYSLLLNIGSIAFVLSDLVLVFILFGHKDTKGMTRLNLTLYYFAQMSLVFTFLVR